MPFIGRKREGALARVVKITDSSNIDEVTYNHDNMLMTVTFAYGGVYAYRNVPPAVFGALVAADSVGTYFNTLKEKYPGVKM
jgi:KTSC domain